MGLARFDDGGHDGAEAGYSLEKFNLYETRARYYLVGWSKDRQHWRILKIDRSEPEDLSLSEDPAVYSQAECKSVLQTVAEGNRSTGGLQLVTKAYGVVGFIRFLECYYMILVTRRRQVGTICGHAVYSIEDTALITVPHPSVQRDSPHSKLELRYKKLLSGVDLTKDFFFSYTYRLMQTFQRNALYPGQGSGAVDTMFVWNAFLTRGIQERLGNTRWTVPLVHGYFSQARLSLFGRVFSVTLLARRSRHFAGTRYLKRGVNDKGRVANDVETEQLVAEEGPGRGRWPITSVVQNRGSIPLFWSQETSKLSPKPDIVLVRYDPVYQATSLHFQDLARRYGNPIIILNLIKTVEKRPREMILRREFANAVGYLNQTLGDREKLKFIHWDFHKFAKTKGANVLTVLGSIAEEALDLTSFFFSGRERIGTHRANQVTPRAAPTSQDDVTSKSSARGSSTGREDVKRASARVDAAVQTSEWAEGEKAGKAGASEAGSAEADVGRVLDGQRPSERGDVGSERVRESVSRSLDQPADSIKDAGSDSIEDRSPEGGLLDLNSAGRQGDSEGKGRPKPQNKDSEQDIEQETEDNGMILVVDNEGARALSPERIAGPASVFEHSQKGDSSRYGTGSTSVSADKPDRETSEDTGTHSGLSSAKMRESEKRRTGHGDAEERPGVSDRGKPASDARNKGLGAKDQDSDAMKQGMDARKRGSDPRNQGSDVPKRRTDVRFSCGETVPVRLQSGVLRTNCIDCLDRTNVAQYAYGLAALARQLHALGFLSSPRLDPESEVAGILMDMYQEMGDVLALQYGGSAAHNMVFPERQGLWKATTQSRELLKTIRRYYSNAYTDAEKQDAINLFLGHFVPEENKPALWELDNDYYLHMGQSAESPQDKGPGPSGGDDPPTPLCLPPHASPPHSADAPPRLKLTSFDKLAATQAAVRHVRLVREAVEPVEKSKAGTSTEDLHVLLTGPSWLFGAVPEHHPKGFPISPRKEIAEPEPRRPEEDDVSSIASVVGELETDPLSHLLSDDTIEPGFTSTDDDDWYGSSLLAGSIETSPAYEHYQRLCQLSDEGGIFSQTPSQTEVYKAYDGIATTLGGGEESDAELEAKMARQLESLSNFQVFMREGQDGLVYA
ncbi:Sac domain-containing Phosphoinositide Phosphatase [Klebsormidium nitens]|uniref:Sac domain-containing Phosphoinositide Phosphatase n=1 Tax=Klebsormidium nitens TaxID=105231 RepID=A0A1Y1HTK4_KLENI|nr:Sac domain-containing Phosphoinositide Phosphatase [Klebsormidium nitens]|eukprot:GAQ79856.1 Sac domain-containing Phosphoinositide Phosphatase [Klebsormidium nitens]